MLRRSSHLDRRSGNQQRTENSESCFSHRAANGGADVDLLYRERLLSPVCNAPHTGARSCTERKGPARVATSGPKSREETPKEGSDSGGDLRMAGSLPHALHKSIAIRDSIERREKSGIQRVCGTNTKVYDASRYAKYLALDSAPAPGADRLSDRTLPTSSTGYRSCPRARARVFRSCAAPLPDRSMSLGRGTTFQ
ncbi:hypothetical protein ABIB95_005701 [Bradyrhizobium sp. LA2.1]